MLSSKLLENAFHQNVGVNQEGVNNVLPKLKINIGDSQKELDDGEERWTAALH